MTRTFASRVRSALTEPLVAMALLGVVFFAVDRARRARDASTIVVDAAVVRSLEIDHERRVGQRPTEAEVNASIERYVDEEVRVREAERLGLARGDVIVRRRMLQKMDQILALTESLDPHARAHSLPTERVSVEHVFFATSRPNAEAEAGRAASELAAGAAPTAMGDPFLHGPKLNDRTRGELEAIFGAAASRVWAAPDGAWTGVLRGPSGFHVARVVSRNRRDERASSGAPPGEPISRDAVARLRERYVVEVRR